MLVDSTPPRCARTNWRVVTPPAHRHIAFAVGHQPGSSRGTLKPDRHVLPCAGPTVASGPDHLSCPYRRGRASATGRRCKQQRVGKGHCRAPANRRSVLALLINALKHACRDRPRRVPVRDRPRRSCRIQVCEMQIVGFHLPRAIRHVATAYAYASSSSRPAEGKLLSGTRNGEKGRRNLDERADRGVRSASPGRSEKCG